MEYGGFGPALALADISAIGQAAAAIAADVALATAALAAPGLSSGAPFSLSEATPYLFAAASGAVAVACALAAAALWRRLRARESDVALLHGRLNSDLTSEKVFVVEPGRLRPASAATESFIRTTAGRRPGRGADGRNALLKEIFGAETAESLKPLLRRLSEAGEGFERVAPDARGDLWRFVGETVGARAVVRLQPASPPASARAADVAVVEQADGAAEGATGGPVQATALATAAALEQAPAGVVLFDRTARLGFANASARRLFRMSEEWIALQPSFRALIDHLRETGRMPERSDYASWRAAAVAAPLQEFAEARVWRLSGGESLRVSAVGLGGGLGGGPGGGPGGADEGFALFVTDETTALESDRRYKIAMGARRATIAAIDEGLAVIGGEGRLQLANPAFVSIWELDSALLDEQKAGQATLADIAIAASRTPEDAAIWSRVTQAIAADSSRARREREFTAPASGDRVLTVRITPLPDGATLIGIADVTDAQRVQKALAEKAEALEAADRLKTEFLNDIAYQLRTPLNAVIGFSDMLRQEMLGPLDRRQQEYLGYVLTAANDLHEFIADTLTLGALSAEAPDSTAAQEALDLPTLGRSVMAMLSKRAERRGVTLEFEDAAGPLPIIGDETRLRQAIFSAGTSVLSCASSGDRVLVRTMRAEERRGGKGKPENGDGPIARFEARLTRRHPLGAAPQSSSQGAALSLARRIVRVHGGRGAFEETAGGAVAVLEFPIRETGAEHAMTGVFPLEAGE